MHNAATISVWRPVLYDMDADHAIEVSQTSTRCDGQQTAANVCVTKLKLYAAKYAHARTAVSKSLFTDIQVGGPRPMRTRRRRR